MAADIDGARRTVRFETYIYAGSGPGLMFRDRLTAAARRGVRVQVLVDAFGSLGLHDGFWTPVRQAGGEVRWFNPLDFRRFMFRDHRKLLVCDGRVACVGGFNIAPEYAGDGVARGWRDTGLRIEGDLAGDLAEAFDVMFLRSQSPHRPFTRFRRSTSRMIIHRPGGAVLLSGPGRGRNAIKRSLLGDLHRARSVRIVAAYFLPMGRVRWRLLRVARRGGTVELILPAKTDVPLSQAATRSLYVGLMEAGVRILEYRPQILHTKLLIVDDAVYVGSSNLDSRSLYINYEVMLRLTGAEVLEGAEAVFSDHRRHSRLIDPRVWQRTRTCWERMRQRWARLLLARVDPLLLRRQLRRLPG